jgi:fumarylpyruvate hydrolase
MGFDASRDEPFFFMKPADAVVAPGQAVPYPRSTSNLHHEIELVVAIGATGRDLPASDALASVYGYAVGNDLTRRDLQIAARQSGQPWEAGKAFEFSAPLSAIQRATDIGHPAAGRIWLEVNGQLRQESDLSLLIWTVPEILARLSVLFGLKPGDLVFTGTPEGVGPLAPGDTVRGGVDGVAVLTHQITQMEP